MDRDTWFLTKAKQVIELLPADARSLLSLLRTRSLPQEIQQATVILFTCQLYRSGWSPDDIAHHWANCGILPADERTILDGVVIPARAIFLSCRLPFHRHWNIKAIAFDFLIYHCAHALRAGIPKELITDDLRTLWLLQTSEGQATLLHEAEVLLNPGVNPPTNLGENDDTLADVFAEMSQSEPVTTLVDSRMNDLRLELKERSDLAGPVRVVYTAAVIHKAIAQRTDESQIVEGVRKLAREVTETIGRWTRTLLPGEVELLQAPEAQALLLEECVRLTPSVKTGAGAEAATLPDSFHGDFLVPEWVADMAFSDGGRFSHNSIGPLPYLLVVFEPGEIGTGTQLRLLKPILTEDRLTLPYQLLDIEDDPLQIEFSFLLDGPSHLRTLALMALTGSCRIDLLTVNRAGRVELLQSTVHEFAEIRQVLEDAAGNAVRRFFNGEPAAFLEAFRNEMTGSYPEVGFNMTEHGKAEELHDLAATIPIEFASGPNGDHWREYAEVRRQVLLHHADRVRALDDQDVAAAERSAIAAESSEARRKVVRHRIRGRASAEAALFFNVPRPDAALAEVCGAGRCFLHFTVGRGALVAFWAMIIDGRPDYGRLDFADFDVDTAILATNQWLATENTYDPAARQGALVEIIRIASESIAPGLADVLLRRGVRHLVISPTWFLELWPLHCAEANVDGRVMPLCDLFDSVTYSPSFRLLVDSIRRKRRAQAGLSAIGYSPTSAPIPNVDRELAALERIVPGATILADRDATPDAVLAAGRRASILHIACHGDWHADDTLRSGLILHGEPWSTGKLYVPRILADGHFHDVDLVVLTACSSGRNLQVARTFQEYRGLDGAFLARGSGAVVSSLWEIDDLVALMVTVGFYEGLLGGMGIDVALKHATGRLRTSGWVDDMSDPRRRALFDTLYPRWTAAVEQTTQPLSDPFYWGAFKASGVTWTQPAAVRTAFGAKR